MRGLITTNKMDTSGGIIPEIGLWSPRVPVHSYTSMNTHTLAHAHAHVHTNIVMIMVLMMQM